MIETKAEKELGVEPWQAPDLELKVEADLAVSQLRFELSSRDWKLNRQRFGPKSFRLDPRKFFDELQERLPEGSSESLAAIGADLAMQILPEALMEELWQISTRTRQREPPPALWLQSEEAWIPWELLRLQGRLEGNWTQGVFLCQAFQLCRWRPGIAPTMRFPMQSLGLVLPSSPDLIQASAEKESLRKLFGERVSELEPFRLPVLGSMAGASHRYIENLLWKGTAGGRPGKRFLRVCAGVFCQLHQQAPEPPRTWVSPVSDPRFQLALISWRCWFRKTKTEWRRESGKRLSWSGIWPWWRHAMRRG